MKYIVQIDGEESLELEILLVFTGEAAVEWESSSKFEKERKMRGWVYYPLYSLHFCSSRRKSLHLLASGVSVPFFIL